MPAGHQPWRCRLRCPLALPQALPQLQAMRSSLGGLGLPSQQLAQRLTQQSQGCQQEGQGRQRVCPKR